MSEQADWLGTTLAFVRQHIPELCIALVWGTLLFYNLGGAPPWWDEGWTMSVARNVLEYGFYGRLKLGALAPNGLEAAPPVVGMVALGMRLFGIGLWQARLLPTLCTAGALVSLYLLGRRLYGISIARGAMAVLLLLVALPNVHPLLIGRNVLGEMPMLFAVLLGYLALRQSIARSPLWLLIAIPVFALAIQIKIQAMPFWAMSLLVPLVVCMILRRWREAVMFAAALGGSYLTMRYGLVPFEALLLAGRTLPGEPITGLIEVVAAVTQPFNRLYTLQITLTWLLPFFIGLGVAMWRWVHDARAQAADADGLTRLVLLVFCGSWWAWFLTLSVGAPRYVFPAVMISGLYLSALLSDLTGGFDWRTSLHDVAAVSRVGLRRRNLGALLTLIMLVCYIPATLLYLHYYYTAGFDHSAERVADYLNTSTPPNALIETYESELYFFLQRPYHYPPDQLHVALIRRTSIGETIPLDYDPLAANPDYVVIGPFGANFNLYDEILQRGKIRLIYREGPYAVYVPVRATGGRNSR